MQQMQCGTAGANEFLRVLCASVVKSNLKP